MADATLRALITHYASDQIASLDDLINASGILRTGMSFGSSTGKFHKYTKTSALPTASVRSIGGSYTDQTVDGEIHQLDLKMIGIVQSEDTAICDEIGVSNYFKQNRPAIMEALGQKMAAGIFYGINSSYGDTAGFIGLNDIADANGSDFYTAAGGTTNTTEIYVVKFKKNVNGIVFNSKTIGAGDLVKTTRMNNGGAVLEYTGSGTKKPVYQILYETDIAYLAASKYSVHVIYGVDATALPTTSIMNNAIDSVKADENTFIYTSRLGRRALWTLKDSNMYAVGNNMDTRIETWNGIRVILDENINETNTVSNLPY